jgi:hypothetical protein
LEGIFGDIEEVVGEGVLNLINLLRWFFTIFFSLFASILFTWFIYDREYVLALASLAVCLLFALGSNVIIGAFRKRKTN